MKKIVISIFVGAMLFFSVPPSTAKAGACEDTLGACQQACNNDACMAVCMKTYTVCTTGVDSVIGASDSASGNGSTGASGAAGIPKSGKLNLVPKKLGEEAGFNTGGESLTITVANIIKSFMGLLGIVVVGIVVYAGFLWMTASGNEEKVGMAKRMITQATVGLILILLAYSIADFIITAAVEGTTGVKVDNLE